MAISMNQVLTGRCDLTRCGLHNPPLRPGWSINATVFQQHGAQSSVRNRLPPKRSRSRRHILEPSPTWCPRRPSILEPLPDDTFPWLWDNNRCSPLYYAARAAYFYSHPNRAFNNAKAVSIMFRGKEYCLKYSNSKTLRQTWRCTGRLYVRNPAPSLCIPISDPSSYIYMRHDNHRAECAP